MTRYETKIKTPQVLRELIDLIAGHGFVSDVDAEHITIELDADDDYELALLVTELTEELKSGCDYYGDIPRPVRLNPDPNQPDEFRNDLWLHKVGDNIIQGIKLIRMYGNLGILDQGMPSLKEAKEIFDRVKRGDGAFKIAEGLTRTWFEQAKSDFWAVDCVVSHVR